MSTDEWEELRAIVEEGSLAFDSASPGLLVLKLAPGFFVEFRMGAMVDELIDHIETPDALSDAEAMAARFTSYAKQIRRAVANMEFQT